MCSVDNSENTNNNNNEHNNENNNNNNNKNKSNNNPPYRVALFVECRRLNPSSTEYIDWIQVAKNGTSIKQNENHIQMLLSLRKVFPSVRLSFDLSHSSWAEYEQNSTI